MGEWWNKSLNLGEEEEGEKVRKRINQHGLSVSTLDPQSPGNTSTCHHTGFLLESLEGNGNENTEVILIKGKIAFERWLIN